MANKKIRFYNPETTERIEVTEKGVKRALKKGFVPSVSEVLSTLDKGEHLTKWRIKKSLEHYLETKDFDASLDYQDATGRNFGTICHALAEEYITGEPCPYIHNKRHLNAVEPFKRWVDENVDNLVFSEEFFASVELGYGGTADVLFKMNNGEQWLCDLKFQKRYKSVPFVSKIEHKYQLSAYRQYFKQKYGDMQICNLLLASPYGSLHEPYLEPVLHDKDYTESFNMVYHLWKERNGA